MEKLRFKASISKQCTSKRALVHEEVIVPVVRKEKGC